jgi:anti-sigma regulatory factor (Ser/Thr protein kinase)
VWAQGITVVVLRLSAEVAAPAAARAAVRDALSARSASLRDIAVLLADEIVTNALVHTGGEIELRVQDRRDSIRIEVFDSSSVAPKLRSPGISDERGRGMFIVDSLASSWGVVQTADGKNVWFELDADDESPDAPLR